MITENECNLSPEYEDLFEVSAGPASPNACRVRQRNSCGSGCLVGHYNGGSLVLTNWHVVSGGVGSQATCQFVINGQDVTKTGRVIIGAYSQRVTADWCILLIPDWQVLKPVYCTRQRPTNADTFYTTGSPACVWPLRHQSGLKLLSNNNAGFVIWNKPAVPGQSGSSVFNSQTNLSQLLLTWRTGNGNGAGQPLDYIYAQAQTAIRTGALIGGMMPEDAEPLGGEVVESGEGFFCETSIRNLPIWFEDLKPEPQPEPGDCCIDKESIIKHLKQQRDSADELIRKLGDCETSEGEPPSPYNTFGL